MPVVLIVLTMVAVPFIVALFVRKDYSVEREIRINRPQKVVFDYIRYLKNHDQFSKWGKMDIHIVRQYYGTDGSIGFIAAWESIARNIGRGEQRITRIEAPQRIEIELRILKPYPSVAQLTMTTAPASRNESVVRWSFSSKMNYPSNLMLLFNIEKAIGKDLEAGLKAIKQQLEE